MSFARCNELIKRPNKYFIEIPHSSYLFSAFSETFCEARRLPSATIEMPTAAQTWLENAEVEEERGHFERCHKILTFGLHYCPYHEAPMLKAIKHLERMGKLDKAHALLGKLAPVPISQCWRTILEGSVSTRARRRPRAPYLQVPAPAGAMVWPRMARGRRIRAAVLPPASGAPHRRSSALTG